MLKILGIIGTVILCILAFILLVLILILFVPIRYKVKAECDFEVSKEVHVKAIVSFLLRLIYVRINEDGTGVLRIFGIPVRRFDGDEEESEATGDSDSASEADARGNFDNTGSPMPVSLTDKDNKENKNNKNNDTNNQSKVKKKKRSGKRTNLFKNIKDAVGKFFKIITDENNKRFVKAVKNIIVRLLKDIKPDMIKADLVVGMEDPAATGILFGFIGIFTVIWPGKYHIIPDFEREILKGKIMIKGKIFNFILLKYIIEAIRNEDIKKVIQKSRR